MAKSRIKEIIETLGEQKDERKRKLQALSIVQNIELESGYKFPKTLKKTCDAWAQDVLGWKGYAPWLYVYASVNREFKEGWIPDNYYGKIVLPQINGDFRKISDIKTLSKRLFNSECFPDIAYQMNGQYYSVDYKPIPRKELKKFIFSFGQDTVVFKLENSRQGRGIFMLNKQNFDMETLGSMGNGVFQKYIMQNEVFAELSPKAVASLRLTSVYELDGSCSIRAAYLRAGSGDDTHVRSASHVRIPIDKETGEFSSTGYTTKWLPIQRHPDSNCEFSGKTVPNFKSCVEIVTGIHQNFPYAKCIGWDVIVDTDGKVQIMEWNARHNDIKFSEAVSGPCFSDLGWDSMWKTNNPNLGVN